MTQDPDHCACDPQWPSLLASIDGRTIQANPARTPGGLACLYYAYCTGCGARYTAPWRLAPRHRGERDRPWRPCKGR